MLSRSDLSAREAAEEYAKLGLVPVPLTPREKKPVMPRWPEVSADQALAHVGADSNLGLALGDPSGGIVDVDLDCPIAARLAVRFLPETAARHGRASSPSSHWWYRVDGAVPKTVQFGDPEKDRPNLTKGMIVEIRGTGGQTMVPPSVHPSGEVLAWEVPLAVPATTTLEHLESAVRDLAAVALVARAWPGEGRRHEAALALAGTLLEGGVHADEVATFVDLVCEGAGDDEPEDRRRAVESTAAARESGQAVSGGDKLADVLGPLVVRQLTKWLGLRPRRPPRRSTSGAPSLPRYERDAGGMYVLSGEERTCIANFSARILRTVRRRDGAEVVARFEIEARHNGAERRFTLSAAEFEALRWPMERVGAAVVIAPGRVNREHALNAIRAASTDAEELEILAQTGWVELAEQPVYLHSEGGIGTGTAMICTQVELPPELSNFALPAPPHGEHAVIDVRASLAILGVASPMISFALLAAAYRAPLGRADFALSLVGPTGVGKSELAARIQQHFGPSMDREHLPGAWGDTGNALSELAYYAADAVLVVDDYAPDTAGAPGAAARVIRAVGNGAGRARLTRDAALRASHPPRCLLISTGEDEPTGKSLVARMLSVPVGKGDVDWALMGSLSRAGLDGRFAGAMAAYIRWLAPRITEVRRRRPAWCRRLATMFQDTAHPRSASAGADLLVGFAAFLVFAVEVGAIDRARRRELWQDATTAIQAAVGEQRAKVEGTDPVVRFLALLRSALASGTAHVTGPDKDVPIAPADRALAPVNQRGPLPLGWSRREDRWVPGGAHIGFVDGDDLLLLPNETFRLVERVAREQGSGLGISPRMLGRLLAEGGHLVLREQVRDRYTVRRTLAGARVDVFHLSLATIVERVAADTAPALATPVPFRAPGLATPRTRADEGA